MSKSAIFLFTKSPSLGAAKTRIANQLGDKKALRIHEAFLKDTLVSIDKVEGPDKFVACTRQGAKFFDQFPNFKVFYTLESQYYPNNTASYVGDLTFSFKYLFSQQYKKVVAVHGDCPDLPEKHIKEALEKLKSHDFVLGPTTDGGFYLLGFKRFIPELFYDARHGTNYALEDIRQISKEMGVKIYETKAWYDIDTVEDLKNLLKTGSPAQFSKEAIKKLKLKFA